MTEQARAATPRENRAAPKARSLRSNGAPSGARPTSPKSAVAPTHFSPLGATISRRAADRLRAGHLWVYASDVAAVTLSKPDETLVHVADSRGLLLGTALYSPSSQIALRLITRESLDEAAWLKLLESRLRAAIARRKPLLDAANDACRLCFSEADELPGLIADKYGDIIVLQFLTKGLLTAAVRETCVRVFAKSSCRQQFTSAPIHASVNWRACPRRISIRYGLPIQRSPLPRQSFI